MSLYVHVQRFFFFPKSMFSGIYTIMFQSRTPDVRLLKILPVRVEKLAIIQYMLQKLCVCGWPRRKYKMQTSPLQQYSYIPLLMSIQRLKQQLGSPLPAGSVTGNN
jgi:hypothetical protein